MKNLCIIFLLFHVCPVTAQQQAKKRGIIMEQIAGLAVYGKAVAKGYDIARDGLSTAHSMKNGTFSLHTGFIDSLSTVSGVVQDNPKVKAIQQLLQRITDVFAKELAWQQAQHILSSVQISYLQRVRDNLLNGCRDDLAELKQVTSNGALQMTDAQRLERIDKLYADMQDKYAFASDYTAKTHRLALAKKQEAEEKQRLKKLYGIQ